MAKARLVQSLQVAVVEDDLGLRNAVRNLLSSAKVPSCGFRAAESFLKASRRRRFACLVTDMDLPGMSGIALHEHLQRAGVMIPTILLTAHEDVSRGVAGAHDAIVKVLRKPFRDGEFLRAIRIALRRSHRLSAAAGRPSG